MGREDRRGERERCGGQTAADDVLSIRDINDDVGGPDRHDS